MFDDMLKQCVSVLKGCVARGTARGYVARAGIWLGPDTASRALKLVVHVVWSQLGRRVVTLVSRSRKARSGGERHIQ